MARRPLTNPRKNASQERSRATVDVLLAATARVLVRDGYDGTSTNKIATQAGVSVGSLYQYFPSKEALVAAVIERHLTGMRDLVKTSLDRVADLPVPQAARELVRVMIEAHRLDPKLHRVLVEQTPRVGNLDLIESLEEGATLLVRAYLERHQDEITPRDLDLAAWMATRTVEALTHVTVLRHPSMLEDARLIDEIASVVINYLQGDAPCYAAGK